jgi:hypothetical protein
MGYIIAIVFILIVTPLLVMMLTRKASGGSRNIGNDDRGVTRSEPSSDEPSSGGGDVNQIRPGAERRIPPG